MSDFLHASPLVESLKAGNFMTWQEMAREGNILSIYDVAIVDGRVSQESDMASVKKHDSLQVNISLDGRAGTHVQLEIWRTDHPELVAGKYIVKGNKFAYFEWDPYKRGLVQKKASIFGGVDVDLGEFSARLQAGNKWPNESTNGTAAILEINSAGIGLESGSRLNQLNEVHRNRSAYNRRVDFKLSNRW